MSVIILSIARSVFNILICYLKLYYYRKQGNPFKLVELMVNHFLTMSSVHKQLSTEKLEVLCSDPTINKYRLS